MDDDLSEDEDEEIDEDQAFNSDDERKYGGLFTSSKGAEGEDESYSETDDEEDDDSPGGDGGEYMLQLLNQLDNDKSNGSAGVVDHGSMGRQIGESQFSSTMLSSGVNGVTLDSMMDSIKGNGVARDLNKLMKPIRKGKAVNAPEAKIVADQTFRAEHYEEQSKRIMSQWLDIVQINRQAEHLDFRSHHASLGKMSRHGLTSDFQPSSDFEKQLQAALEEEGQKDDEEITELEEKGAIGYLDDLGESTLTVEQYKKRRAQLAKMRALLFYHEQKRHHMNKIKSKKYRRIRKKQKARQAEEEEANLDLESAERELSEKEEILRVRERMTLAHKNTSKWAKRILKRGNKVDKETRRALSAQVTRGDDLVKRMHVSSDGDQDEDSDEDLVESAQKVLTEIDKDEDADKGVFKLAFMQRGIKRQREQAKQEARQLLQDLQKSEDLELGVEQPGGSCVTPEKRRREVASAAEMKDVIEDGTLVVSALQVGSSTVSSTGAMNGRVPATSSECFSSHSLKSTDGDVHRSQPGQVNTVRKSDRERDLAKDEENPWLKSRTSVSSVPSEGQELSVSVSVSENTSKVGSCSVETEQDSVVSKSITHLSQEELVKRAFVGATEIADTEFSTEKDIVEEHEDPERKKKKEHKSEASRGWGSWAGEGAKNTFKASRLPPKLQPPKLKAKQKRRDARRPRVILSEKRVKKLADSCMLTDIPYPYKSREEYERAMVGGIGKEWNVTSSHSAMVRPAIQTRAGQVIQPISQHMKAKKKAKRAPAKFY